MRDIKFRAWDKQRCKWAERFILAPTSPSWGAFNLHGSEELNDLLNAHEKKKYPKEPLAGCNCNEIFDWSDYYGLNNYEVMQFTGLHDQNGREIYEGDILKWEHSDRTLEVRWEGAGWVLFSKMFQKFGMPDGDTCSPINTSGYTRNSVVVGNIHENPELLKA